MKTLALTFLAGTIGGCAITPDFGESNLKNFNQTFKKQNLLDPQFSVSEATPGEITIVVHQGKPLIAEGSTRYFFLEQAGKTIAANFCGDLGFKAFRYRWRQHGNSGWVHLMGTFSCVTPGRSSDKNDLTETVISHI